MRIDVSELVQQVLPWECELKIGDTWHRVRPPTIADVDALTKLKRDSARATEQQSAQTLGQLFEEPRPDLSRLTLGELLVVATAINTQLTEYTAQKKVELLTARLQERSSTCST